MTNADFIRRRAQQWATISTNPVVYETGTPITQHLELFHNKMKYGGVHFFRVGTIYGGTLSMGTDMNDNVYARFYGWVRNHFLEKNEQMEVICKVSINLETEAVELGML